MTPAEIRSAINVAEQYAADNIVRYELTEEQGDARAYTFLKAWLLAHIDAQ